MVVLVTGGNGQLGQSLQFLASNYADFQFVFTDSSELDITNLEACYSYFEKVKPAFCINAAAYTAVDKAETDAQVAHKINCIGAENLAKAALQHQTILLHISTDFIFDGLATVPYTENAIPNPKSVYGKTKLDGELAIQSVFDAYFIIRTSWVYSQFGNNFLKTMLRLAKERENLSVVADQIGTPTNAVDLATLLLDLIAQVAPQKKEAIPFGIYNFSNEGQCSWYEFAKEIFEQTQTKINLKPIPSSEFPTPAQRPSYSVLDKTKIKKAFNITILDWKESLTKCF
jgi:dTDP-4-dehydrorhamnose reductase